jgi:hypothetical protein
MARLNYNEKIGGKGIGNRSQEAYPGTDPKQQKGNIGSDKIEENETYGLEIIQGEKTMNLPEEVSLVPGGYQVGRHPAKHAVGPQRLLAIFGSEIRDLLGHALELHDIMLIDFLALQYIAGEVEK